MLDNRLVPDDSTRKTSAHQQAVFRREFGADDDVGMTVVGREFVQRDRRLFGRHTVRQLLTFW